MRNIPSQSRWQTRWEMCSFHMRRPTFLSYAQALWDSQKPQVTQCVLSRGSREQKAQVEGAHRCRGPAREATPRWVTLGTGRVPGLGACPVNDDLPYSIIICLDLVKVVHWTPWLPYTFSHRGKESTQTKKKITPSLPSIFFLNLSLQTPDLFQQFLWGYVPASQPRSGGQWWLQTAKVHLIFISRLYCWRGGKT